MRQARRLAFSFRFDRLGPTHWGLARPHAEELIEGEASGVRLEERNRRMEWYRVVVELEPDEDPADDGDLADIEGRALALARAKFLEHHRGEYLVD